MSYLTQAQEPRRRAAALSGTLAVHVALGFAIVTGLTIAGAVPIDEIFTAVPVTPDAKPTPPPPEPQKQETTTESKVTAPPTPIDLTQSNQQVEVTEVLPPRDIVFVPDPPIARPEPPRPIATFVPRKAAPSNNINGWVTTDDYPSGPLRNEIEGIAGYRVIVGSNGRVASCEITRSSGNSQLDGTTCRKITQRARFEAATDETGAKVVGSFTGSVVWEIPD